MNLPLPSTVTRPMNTTGFSGGSSLGLQYKGVWCTPPRIFVDQQDEVIPHLEPGMVPSTVDPDSASYIEKANKSKKQVKISAWKLAKLDYNEAMKAAAKARASSSVLRPIEGRHIPGTQTASSLSSLQHIHEHYATPNPLPLQPSNPVRPSMPRGPHAITQPANIPNTQPSNAMFRPATSLIRESRRSSVVWDQEVGRYVSVPPSLRADSTEVTLRARVSAAIPAAEVGGYGRRTNPPNSSLPSIAPLQQ